MSKGKILSNGKKFTRYANLSDEDRDMLVMEYRAALDIGATDEGHAAAIAASRLVGSKGWNGKAGADAFAATLATLVMRGEIVLVDAKRPSNRAISSVKAIDGVNVPSTTRLEVDRAWAKVDGDLNDIQSSIDAVRSRLKAETTTA